MPVTFLKTIRFLRTLFLDNNSQTSFPGQMSATKILCKRKRAIGTHRKNLANSIKKSRVTTHRATSHDRMKFQTRIGNRIFVLFLL